MKKLIQDIHEQPEHIRLIFMWVSVVIVFGIIGFFSFRHTVNSFARAVNPERGDTSVALFGDEDGGLSPFALFRDSIGDLTANIGGVFGGNDEEEITPRIENIAPAVEPRQLPVD